MRNGLWQLRYLQPYVVLHHLKHLVKNNENITTLGTQQVQSSGKDKMYEYVKKEIRARYGKDAINDKNKHKLKSLAIAAPFCSFSREHQHPKWELASKMFGEEPFSNGHDKRYEEVKAVIRKKFGESSINESNKARLKALALAGKQSKEVQAVGEHPKWKLAQDMFSQPPYVVFSNVGENVTFSCFYHATQITRISLASLTHTTRKSLENQHANDENSNTGTVTVTIIDTKP